MKKKAFTLLEIIVVVVIIGILTTVGLPVYQNIVQSSKDRIDYINLETLQTWVDIKTMEQGSVPASLSKLKQEDWDKAYAQVMRGKDTWKNQIAYFIVNGPQWGLAYAQGSVCPRLRSPNNPDPSPDVVSYGINAFVAKKTLSEYRNLDDSIVIVAVSDELTFSYPACPAVKGGPSGKIDNFLKVGKKMGSKNYNILTPSNIYLNGITKGHEVGKIYINEFKSNKGVVYATSSSETVKTMDTPPPRIY